MKNHLQNPKVQKVIAAIGAVIIVVIIFQAGVMFGFRKAGFAMNWNANYSRGMHDPRFMLSPFAGRDTDLRPNGIVGEIVSINLPSIMIKGKTTTEEVVLINPKTIIHKMRNTATTTDLKIGDSIVVIGQPNSDGQINASLIRIIPANSSPYQNMMGSTTNSMMQFRKR